MEESSSSVRMPSRQAVSAGAKVFVTVKTMEQELKKDEPDLRDLRSKLGKAKVAWLPYHEAYETL
jgi:hypothetical protein